MPVIAAVSCDPASFARDAAILVAGGYRLDWVQPVDQFRWSGHVELAARLQRAERSLREEEGHHGAGAPAVGSDSGNSAQ